MFGVRGSDAAASNGMPAVPLAKGPGDDELPLLLLPLVAPWTLDPLVEIARDEAVEAPDKEGARVRC